MVRRIKKECGIKCLRHKRFKVTTNSNHNKLVHPNHLDRTFNVNRPNESWVSDITYIWTNEGSMSRRDNCFDNAPIERFWDVVRNELEYNQTRIQKGLGYKSPKQVWFDYYRQAA